MSGYRGQFEDDDSDGASGGIETVPPGKVEDVAVAMIRPIRDAVAKTEQLGDESDRRFRRDLDEIIYDIEHGITPHSAGRAVMTLDGAVDGWFSRRQARLRERDSELTGVISSMGQALKDLQGDEGGFHDGLDAHLSRLTSAADSVQVRSVSARINRIVEATKRQAVEQKQASENRVRHMSEMMQGLVEQLEETQAALERDALTGLYNRGSFDQRMERELKKTRLSPYNFSLIMIDLDKFKDVNDSYGHIGGDRVLKACAQSIQAVVMRTTDFCARYGGEEMAIILSDTDGATATRVAEDVRKRIMAEPVQTGSALHTQTASLGVAQGADTDTAEDLIHRADGCLYLAKQNGRNKVVTAGEGLGRRIALPDALL
jgi:diguanylate cyclase